MLASMRILLVEDDSMIGEAVQALLRAEGYAVDWAGNAESAETALRAQAYDLVLLDLGLPGSDGLQVLRGLRARKSTTPVLIATARDAIKDRVQGLDAGADDYIVKPFAIEELLARLRAVLRRVKIEKDASKDKLPRQKVVKFKDLTIETANRIVHRGDGKTVDLTKREYNLLMTLIENKNNVVGRDQLLNKIWGPESNIETNVVEVYVRYLRNKIDIPGQPSYIKTVRGTGYMVRDEDDNA